MANIKEHVQILVRDTTLLPGLEPDFPFPAHAESHYLDGVDPLNLGLDDQNGFADYTDVTEAFDDGTRTISLTPVGDSFSFWSEGLYFTKTDAVSLAITDVEGLHWVYFDTDGEIRETTTYTSDLITKYCFIAAIHWDATNSKQIYFARELRHANVMDGATHLHEHDTEGFELWYGGALGDFTIGDGSLDSHIQFSNEASGAYDEDAQFTYSQRLQTANLPVYYRTGADSSNIWRIDEDDSFAVLPTGTGRAAWNELTGGNWQLTETTNGKFLLAHIIVTNDTDRPFAAIMGQAEYNNVVAARDGAETEVNSLVLEGLFTPEFYFLGTVIYQTNTSYANAVKSKIVQYASGVDYVDLRGVLVGKSGTSIPATDHGALSGLGDDDHTQYLLVDGTRNMTGGLTFTGSQTIATSSNGNLSLIPNGTGLVNVGSGSPSYLTPTSGELFVQSNTEIQGTIYSKNIRVDTNNIIYTSSNYGQIQPGNSYQTVDSMFFITGAVSKYICITDSANSTKNHDYAAPTNPTLYINSATNPDSDNTQWLSISHDQTDGVLTAGTGIQINTSANGDINLVPNGTGITIVGSGSSGFSLADNGCIVVTSCLEIQGDVYADPYLNSNTNFFFGYESAGAGTASHVSGTQGWYNTAVGYRTMYDLTTGYYNVAYGYSALKNVEAGFFNVALGPFSLFTTTDGKQNIAIGESALRFTTNDYNIAIGYRALYTDTSGRFNMALGRTALFTNSTGDYNCCFGDSALYNCTGDNNMALGYKAGYNVGAANGNLLVGYQAGDNITTGDYNVIIGYDLDAASATADYQLNICGVITCDNYNSNGDVDIVPNGTGDVILGGGSGTVDFAGATRTASTVTHDAYVTLSVAGTPYKFMLGS